MEIDIEPMRDAAKFLAACVTLNEPADGSEPEPATDGDWELHNMACALACEADKIERAAAEGMRVKIASRPTTAAVG